MVINPLTLDQQVYPIRLQFRVRDYPPCAQVRGADTKTAEASIADDWERLLCAQMQSL